MCKRKPTINQGIVDGLQEETADGRRFLVTRHDDNVCDYNHHHHHHGDDDMKHLIWARVFSHLEPVVYTRTFMYLNSVPLG